jgi:DNA-binding XRE family transcriptional regulator
VTATGGGAKPATDATPRIRFEIFDRECERRGAQDETAKAELVGVDRTTLWRWRNGRLTPSLAAATRIAETFDLTVEELIERAA